jgi:gamma-glutamyl:cysteine ligase YbdK (ATP-grasp superfamily)
MVMNKKHSLFSVIGIEIEYMIVNQSSLNVNPIADLLLQKLAGEMVNEVELGEIAASNELALHVIELKTNGPKKESPSLDKLFYTEVQHLNQLLLENSACLMPTGAHPWYNPHESMKLWPHGDQTIYNTFDRIFNCQGHGWSNLQSVHINLPFANDEEFSQLHNAIRLLMPLIPALTASTPFIEGKETGLKDTRLSYYGNNQKKIPCISGHIIPEFITTETEYQEKILTPMYQAIAPFDPDTIMQDEWLNSRGAIARFDRSAIEIRVVDSQECPLADIACVTGIVHALKYIIFHTEVYKKTPLSTERLSTLYKQTIKDGMETSLEGWADYLNSFEFSNKKIHTARDFWEAVFSEKKIEYSHEYQTTLENILTYGNLAERLLNAYKSQSNLALIYQELCTCLNENSLFRL